MKEKANNLIVLLELKLENTCLCDVQYMFAFGR